jgi:hypothetical protein
MGEDELIDEAYELLNGPNLQTVLAVRPGLLLRPPLSAPHTLFILNEWGSQTVTAYGWPEQWWMRGARARSWLRAAPRFMIRLLNRSAEAGGKFRRI